MAQIAYRGNLSAKVFPFVSEYFGRTIRVQGQDQNFSRQLASSEDLDKDRGIPQAYYCHNILPIEPSVGSPTDLAISLIKTFEGCSLKAYQDIVGVWTMGYGETLGVVEGMVWTQEEVEKHLNKRVDYFLCNAYLKCPQLFLEPPERVAACVSLAYNIGLGAFGASSVCRYTKLREYDKAAKSFLLWNKAGGRVVKGLSLRRLKESKLYGS